MEGWAELEAGMEVEDGVTAGEVDTVTGVVEVTTGVLGATTGALVVLEASTTVMVAAFEKLKLSEAETGDNCKVC